MHWDAIAAVGQAVSALALMIVIVQVRHARREVRRSVSQSRSDAARELILTRVNSERLNGLLIKAAAGLTSGRLRAPFPEILMERCGLTYEEGTAVYLEQHAWWQYRSQAIAYADELTVGERFGFDAYVRGAYEAPVGRLWYEMTKATLNPDTVRYVDNVLAQPG